MRRRKYEPDPVLGLGVGAVFLSSILFGVVLFVPAREGASASGKFSIVFGASMLMAWGIKQIQAARRQKKRRAHQNHDGQT